MQGDSTSTQASFISVANTCAGQVWEGPVDEEGRPHGTGIMKYAAHLAEEDEEEKPGDVYAGCMEHGVRTGRAKYTWTALGAVYDGDYVGAKKHGTGTMIYPDKGRYEGVVRTAGANVCFGQSFTLQQQ